MDGKVGIWSRWSFVVDISRFGCGDNKEMTDNCTKMEDDLKEKELYPRFKARIESFLTRLDRLGYKIGIFSGRRCPADQDRLYSQGRTETGKIVTNAKGTPPESMHIFGLACDLVWKDEYDNWSWKEPKEGDWKLIVEVSKEFKLHNLGDSIGDWPHYEANFGFTLKELQALFNEGGLQRVWSTLDSQASIKTA